jgi:acetyltransferase-like isoleucine patch superfamily enzyme
MRAAASPRIRLRSLAKSAAYGLASVAAAPAVAGYWLSAACVGRNRALEGWSQLLSLVPGLPGQYLRRGFYPRVLAHCHPSATIEFGAIFSQAGACIGAEAYVGPRCNLGLVHLGDGCLLGPAVSVPSGGRTHAFDDPSRPIHEQGGERSVVRIGAGAWVGANAVVMAGVGDGAVIGAGAVVTREVPAGCVAVGVPARVVRRRDQKSAA